MLLDPSLFVPPIAIFVAIIGHLGPILGSPPVQMLFLEPVLSNMGSISGPPLCSFGYCPYCIGRHKQLEQLGLTLGHLGAILGPSGGSLGAILGPSWATLGPRHAPSNKAFWRGEKWVLFGSILVSPWAILSHLGAILRPSGGSLGTILGPSWVHLRATFGLFWVFVLAAVGHDSSSMAVHRIFPCKDNVS